MTLVPEQAAEVAQAGDDVYLGSILARLHLWGIVSDLDTPAMMSGSLEVLGDEMALVMDALVGPRGPAGANAPIVKMQWHSNINDPNDLPPLINDEADIGKGFWIGNQVYVWSGFNWQIHAMGSPGPAGPVPRISPTFEVVDGPTDVEVTGTTTHPSWHMHVNREEVKGPPGPSAAIFNAQDYDPESRPGGATPAEIGQFLTVIPNPSGIETDLPFWAPRTLIRRDIRFYSVPEGAFQPFIGITPRQQICAYTVQPLPFDWIPRVGGHLKAIGIDFSLTPLQIGVEVRLNHISGGQLIARGHGEAYGWQTISPHYSSPGDPATATNPDNPIGMVPAGEAATLFVSLVSTGMFGAYIFGQAGAQLEILAVPARHEVAA